MHGRDLALATSMPACSPHRCGCWPNTRPAGEPSNVLSEPSHSVAGGGSGCLAVGASAPVCASRLSTRGAVAGRGSSGAVGMAEEVRERTASEEKRATLQILHQLERFYCQNTSDPPGLLGT